MQLCRSILPFIMLLVVSCGSPNQVAKVAEVDPSGWFSPSELLFEVTDTTSRVDLSIILRYNNEISADSIELMVSTITPSRVIWSEPFTLYTPLADKAISVVESLYRKEVKWSEEGEYKILLHPQHIYKGISAAGVEIIQQE